VPSAPNKCGRGVEAVALNLFRMSLRLKPGKRFMFGSRRHFFLGAVAYSSAFFACASPGYLPVVGPAPLRFRPVLQPSRHVPAPPAASTTEPNPIPEKTKIVEPVTAPATLLSAPAPEPPVAAGQTNAVVEPSRPEDVVSPQMLIKYFNKSTNGSSTMITAPIDFTPPRSGEPPSSKASYSTSP